MKTKGATADPLASPLAEPFAFSQGWVHRRVAIIVEIETADGVVGIGAGDTPAVSTAPNTGHGR